MRRKMRMATLGCTVAMAVFPASALADETAAHNEAVVQQIQEALVVENAAPTTPVEQFQLPASLAEGLSATEVEQLQEIADNAPATASTDVQLPSNGDGRVVVDSGESRVTLGVPGEGTAVLIKLVERPSLKVTRPLPTSPCRRLRVVRGLSSTSKAKPLLSASTSRSGATQLVLK